MKLIGIFIFIALTNYCQCCENCGLKFTKNVNYYKNVIRRGIEESLNYRLPNSAVEYKPETNKTHDYGWFDFIIVGAGPTGSVIANRLSEISKWKVLVLEAGESPTEFSEIPGVYEFLGSSKFNWNYKSVKRPNSCLGFVNQQCSVSRGKIMGGSSGINSLLYARGNKEDFRRWSSQGNKGWTFDDVLPHYVKSENCQTDGDPKYRGKGGYWNVKRMKSTSPNFEVLVKAHRQVFNCSLNNDYNGRSQLGISNIQFNIIRNKRHSAGDAFLKTAQKRKNLIVQRRAFVLRVLISNLVKRAHGIEFTHEGKIYHASARKEVILSAGTISSPKILMLSGIGPREELKKHNISVIKNLPVGKTLYEPAGFLGLFIETNISVPEKTFTQNVKDYLSYSGGFENPGNADGIGFYQSSFVKAEGYPDIQFKYFGIPSVDRFAKKFNLLTDETFDALWAKLNPRSTFGVYTAVLQPKSVGSVQLASSDPYEYPLIDLNILGEPHDVEVLLQALKIIKQLLEAPAMRAINASMVYGDFPRCRKYEAGSENYWKCAFELLGCSTYAASSTCRMGPDQTTAVVNDKLEVHGVRGLRVADVSVFPDPVAAAPTATAVMIGEKISDTIKADHGEEIQPIDNYLD